MGLSYEEILRSAPGLVMDAFFFRRDYDDAQHGVTRHNAAKWSEE